MGHKTYQPEIDGLRTIAVLAVVLFHFKFSGFGGGFVGVDVFFVISGFLITRLIYNEIDRTGSFDFQRFYARRIRRLMPALFVTCFATFCVAYFILIPKHLESLSLSVISAIFSLSNILFWSESGYFDISSEVKPLLHTWSLSVEEQFYLFWPLCVFLFYSSRLVILGWLILAISLFSFSLNLEFQDGNIPWLANISVGVAEWFSDGKSSIYFLTPFRIFEFGIGAAILWITPLGSTKNFIKEVLLALGLIAIAVSVLVLDENDIFPTYNALLPCIGTALCIYAGKAKFLGYLLRNPISVSIGLISYSLYLLHWPIYVLYKYWRFDEIQLIEKFGLLAISMLFSILMYKYVETPFRQGFFALKLNNSRRSFIFAACGALVVATPALVGWHESGWENRYANVILPEGLSREKLAHSKVKSICRIERTVSENCDLERNNRVLVLGDSHSPAWAYALNSVNSDADTQYFLLSYLKCHSDFEVKKTGVKSEILANNCKGKAEFLTENRSFLASLDKVILASYRPFSYQANQFRFGLLEYITDQNPNIEVVILGNYFQIEGEHTCEVIALRNKDRSACLNKKYASYVGDLETVKNEPFYTKQMKPNYQFVDIPKLFCPTGENCPYEYDGIPYMLDKDHLTYGFVSQQLQIVSKNNRNELVRVGLF